MRLIEVTEVAGRRDLLARGEHPGSGDQAGVDRIADRHVQPWLRGTGTDDAGETVLEQQPGVTDGRDQVLLDRHQRQLHQVRHVRERDVSVSLDQPGHHGATAEVQRDRALRRLWRGAYWG